MAVKNFSAGAVLSASDTNTYLANSGLVYVASKTFTATTSVQQFLGCFTSTYDNYKVVYQGTGSLTSPVYWYYQYLTGTTVDSVASYYANPIYSITGGGPSVNWNTSVNVGYAGWLSSTNTIITFDVISPTLATETNVIGSSVSFGNTQSINGTVVGFKTGTSSYNGIQFGVGGGSTQAGTITIYGYRKG